MKVRDLLTELAECDPDADVYYSTGSGMDNTRGHRHEVENCWSDIMQIGILTNQPKTIQIVVLEGI